MQLGELLRDLCQEGVAVTLPDGDEIPETGALSQTDVTDIVYDSRKVQPGCLFVCLPGAVHDGHAYAAAAAEKGAAAIFDGTRRGCAKSAGTAHPRLPAGAGVFERGVFRPSQ